MKTITLLSILILSFVSNAQDEHSPSMFWNNYTQFNPAVSGLEYQHKGILSYRNEWPSLSGNRRTLFANYDGRIGRRHGVGLNLTSSRRYWGTQHQEVQVNYSYHHVMKNSRRISIGVSPSYNRSAVSEVWGPPISKTNSLNFNTGIAYQGSTILAGIGVTQLFNIASSEGGGATDLKPNFFAHFRKIFQIGRNLDIFLDGVYQTADGFHSAKLNARVVLYDKFMFGGGIGGRNNLMAQVGWDIDNRFRVAYAYDASVSKLSNGVSGGSHEFTLGYVMKYRVRNLSFRNISTPNF
ncbi:MAG: type IX secretion system PorP/SprF family membrane protein [Crocinitomicaceae bacterium]|jgi:type IX secretion system PorP/SprF family membrane protein